MKRGIASEQKELRFTNSEDMGVRSVTVFKMDGKSEGADKCEDVFDTF